jgi:hypothetical protein
MTTRSDLPAFLARLNVLEEQVQRHEAEISICLDRRQAELYPTRIRSLEDILTELTRSLKGEQMYRQGQAFFYGERDMAKNVSLGLSILKEAADMGHCDAAFAYGSAVQAGKVSDLKPEEATHYFGIAARGGNNVAQFRFGFCLANGIGIAKNATEAVKYYKLSADQGNANGQFRYGL